MEVSFYVRIILLCCVFVIQTQCDPIGSHTNGRISTLGQNLFNSFGDVAGFLRKWFSKIRGRVQTNNGHIMSEAQQTERARLRRNVYKRGIKLPTPFEEIGRQYLLIKSQTNLEQFFSYLKYIKNDNETRTQIDLIMQEQIEKLQSMTLEQLKAYCAQLQEAMRNGISLSHEITVNGKRYSLSSIAHVCCPWG